MTNVNKANPIEQATNLKAIDALIKNVKRGYENSAERVQRCALMILEHAKAYNDCDRARFLCRAVPARERNSLIGWFLTYSPIGVVMGRTAVDDKVRFLKETSPKRKEFDIPAARENPWWNDPAGVNPEPKALLKAADFWDMIERLIERQLKNAKDGAPRTGDPVFEEGEASRVAEGAEKILDFTKALRSKQLAAIAAKNEAENKDDAPGVPQALKA